METAPTLSETVREARQAEGLGVRELARRGGLDPSQISRIESGEVVRPDMRTLMALATALGRSWIALEFLADPQRADAETLTANSSAEASVLRDQRRWSDEEIDDLVLRAGTDEDEGTIARLSTYAHDVFLYVPLSEQIERFASAAHYAGLEGDQVEALIRVWIGLTDERRELVAAYAAEQEVLSELDRRDSNPQKVRLEIRRSSEVGK